VAMLLLLLDLLVVGDVARIGHRVSSEWVKTHSQPAVSLLGSDKVPFRHGPSAETPAPSIRAGTG
jgi:hypothetical protein